MPIENLERIPWGPGEIALRKPLRVEVEQSGDDVVLVLADIGNGTFWGKGADYARALLDIAGLIEHIIEERARESSVLLEYLPEDVL